jgi:2-oxoglutarate dehydrogenase complex dehydrogenase (E1) component-like enzyme
MDKQMIKDMLYGTIREMQDNNRYYYRSTVGVEYSHWRDEGEQQLAQMIKLISARVDQIERDSLRAASQKMLLDELGKDHT